MVFLIVLEAPSHPQSNTLFLNLILLSFYQPYIGRYASRGWDAGMSPVSYISLKVGKSFIIYIVEKGVVGSIKFDKKRNGFLLVNLL